MESFIVATIVQRLGRGFVVQEVEVHGAPELMRFSSICGLHWNETGIEMLTAVTEFTSSDLSIFHPGMKSS